MRQETQGLLTVMTVLPASAKAPGVPARTGDMPVTETVTSAKRESGKLVEL
jgi:hypothetical protein